MENIDIKISDDLVDYQEALEYMEKRVSDIYQNKEKELLWFLEHPPLYTAGTSANIEDLKDKDKFPVYNVGRGGQYTYHGPGQRVVYTMLDLKKRQSQDIKLYVKNLEQWIINSLKKIGINGERRDGRVGIWIASNNNEEKIAAIGIRVRKWVTFHGIAINVNPNLSNFSGIVPCGISNYGVTSIEKLNNSISMSQFDKILLEEFQKIFT